MITQVNEKNSAKYRKLFDEASKLMAIYLGKKNSDIKIEDIVNDSELYEEYYIKDLYSYFFKFGYIMEAALEKDEDEDAPDGGDSNYWQKYFSILPLDEPVFTIDANTRKIEIPEQFKTIGVEGDVNAEIIFFTIDRFFDAMDFGAKEVTAAIEWKRTSDKEGDIDAAYIKELTTYDNKILIGWVIDEEIASIAGSIDFAVRLYVEENKKDDQGDIVYGPDGKPERILVYSFSTETKKINIAKTLNIYPDSDQKLDITTAAQVLNRIASMTTPEDLWGENTLLSPIFINKNEEALDYNTSYNIGDLDNVFSYKENGIDTGKYYADLDDDSGKFMANVKGFSRNGTGEHAITYLWHDWNEETGRWDPLGVASTFEAGGNEYPITQTGRYKCVVQDNVSTTRISKADSEVLYILKPEKPQVKAYEEGQTYYSRIIPDKTNELTEPSVELVVKPALPEGKFITGKNDENTKTKKEYIWYKSSDAEGTNKVEMGVFSEEENYFAKDEGYYFGYVKTKRNKKEAKSDQATIYRVTYNLQPPTEEEYSILNSISNPSALAGVLGETIKIDLTNYAYDSIEYQWYMSENNLNTPMNYTKVITEGSHGIVKDGIISFVPKTTGYYKVNIKISRNGQVYPADGNEITNEGAGHELIRSNGTPHYITIQGTKKI